MVVDTSANTKKKAKHMGVMLGYQQVSLYVDPTLYRRAKSLADSLGVPMYQMVNDALRAEIDRLTTPEARKALDVLSALKGKFDGQNGHADKLGPPKNGTRKRGDASSRGAKRDSTPRRTRSSTP